MKKIFATIFVFVLFVGVLVGCKQETSANLIAKDLDNNLNKLEVAVTKLDTVENKYLANPDIYSSLTATPTTTEGKYFALAFNNNTAKSSTDIVKQALIDKITDKLLQNNTNYNEDDSLTCKKYCDTNGDCYYTDCNGNNYCYSSNGNCYDCSVIPSTCSYVGETSLKSEYSENDGELVATQLSVESENVDVVNNSESEGNIDENITNENETPDISTNIEEDNDYSLNTPNPRVKVFYFSQDSFTPVRLKYNPRFISQYNETTINEQIDSYLSKVQKLYAMSEDSIEANSTLANCKQNIIDCVKEIKELNDCILSGNCEPTIEQLQALNNYIIDIKTTTKRLKDCNGELTKEVSKIGQSNTNAMINSVDVMSSNYMRLINHIDTRVTYHKSAIATLQQIKYLLDNAVNNNEITDEEIEKIIEDLTIADNEKTDNIINEDNITNLENDENQNIEDNKFNDTNNVDIVNNGDVLENNSDIYNNNYNVYDNITNNNDTLLNNENSVETNNNISNNNETNDNITTNANNENNNIDVDNNDSNQASKNTTQNNNDNDEFSEVNTNTNESNISDVNIENNNDNLTYNNNVENSNDYESNDNYNLTENNDLVNSQNNSSDSSLVDESTTEDYEEVLDKQEDNINETNDDVYNTSETFTNDNESKTTDNNLTENTETTTENQKKSI